MTNSTAKIMLNSFEKSEHLILEGELANTFRGPYDYNWLLDETELRPYVFRGSCMKSMDDFVREFYAVLQLQLYGNKSWDSVFDHLTEFHHWKKKEKFVFIFLDEKDIFISEKSQRERFLSVLNQFFKFIDSENSESDLERKGISVFV